MFTETMSWPSRVTAVEETGEVIFTIAVSYPYQAP